MVLCLRFLIGIVSFGETYCGGLNNPRPGVYTNITSHVQWVRQVLHISKTSIPRSATYGLKWREEVVKDGALGQSGEPAASPVVWASRPGDVQVGEVGRCKAGERLVGRKIFWTKGKQTSTGKESVPGLAGHRSPCLGMLLASRCFKPDTTRMPVLQTKPNKDFKHLSFQCDGEVSGVQNCDNGPCAPMVLA